MMAHSKYTVAIAGNIGAGKSSLTEILRQSLGWKAFYEAVDENPYLDDFYQDMRRWSFHSQIFFLARRLRDHHQMVEYPHSVLQDRSIYEDAEIFARNLYVQGLMSERDYASYHDLYAALCQVLPPPTLVIYIRASVPTLIERIRMRGRDYEQNVPQDYLTQLNTLYGEWADAFGQCPLLTIDGDQVDFVHDAAQREALVQQIIAALPGYQASLPGIAHDPV